MSETAPTPYFHTEIPEQPAAVRASLAATEAQRQALAGQAGQISRVVIVGSGDSFFLGHAAAAAFEQLAGLPAEAVEAYDFVTSRVAAIRAGALVVGVSASGKALYTIEAVERAARAGALTAAVTNSAAGPLASKAGVALITSAGTSYTFPTKTTTAALAVLCGLAADLGVAAGQIDAGRYGAMMEELAVGVPRAIELLLQGDRGVAAAAALLRDRRQLILVGSGAGRAAALVGAAKICETCRLPAIAINAEEYLHLVGFSVGHADTVVVLGIGPATDREQQVAEYALRQGAAVIVVAEAGPAVAWPSGATLLRAPVDRLAPWSRALVTMVLLHQLAGALSALVGSNPDRPEQVDLAYVLKLLYTTPLQGWL